MPILFYTNSLRERVLHRFVGVVLHGASSVAAMVACQVPLPTAAPQHGILRPSSVAKRVYYLPENGGFEQSPRRFTRERAGEIVSLGQVAPHPPQPRELLLRLYTLGYDLKV